MDKLRKKEHLKKVISPRNNIYLSYVVPLYLIFCKIQKLNILRPFLLIGDEILAINGKSLQGLSHDDAINEFRAIKNGQVILQVAKREVVPLVQKG